MFTGLMVALMAASILASTGVGVYQAYKNRQAQKEANDTNILMNQANNDLQVQEAEKNREWQTEMSNSAHQREMADLEAAGLNPILAAGGQGASTPSVVQPLTSASKVNPVQTDLSGVTAALNSMSNLLMTHALINSGKFANAAAERASAATTKAEAARVNSAANMMKAQYGVDVQKSHALLNSAKTNYYNNWALRDFYRKMR